MLESKTLANASALVALIVYFACALLVWILPDLAFNFAALSVHGLNLEPLRPVSAVMLNITNLVIGALVWTALVWLVIYLTGYLYNSLKK